VVVEAAEDGGALSTARSARLLGRAVLAVPGDVDRPASRGTLGLIRGGARVCADAGDVLAALEAGLASAASGSSGSPPLDPGARLRARLGPEPASVEELAAACGLTVAETLARLLRFQWSGLAVPHPGGRWSSRPQA